MPRRNKHKVLAPLTYGASSFDTGFKAECYGCAFIGKDFECLTSDGQCLKSKIEIKADDISFNIGENDRHNSQHVSEVNYIS